MKARKLFALLLALVMVLSLSVPAFADDGKGSITIMNPKDGETYTVYQIFELSYTQTNPVNPSVSGDKGYPYTYYIAADSPWLAAVQKYATDDNYYDDDGDPSTDPIFDSPDVGLVLDPVYATDRSVKGYNVTVNGTFDAALFAAAMKKALKDNTVTDTGTVLTVPTGGKLPTTDGLPLGYYLVDSENGALASLTSTDPDVEVYDKNEEPNVDKVIVEDEIPNPPLYGETDPKYVAYELFRWTTSNVEWGKDVKQLDFDDDLQLNDDLMALYDSTYGPGDATSPSNPGDTVARKWYDLYIANEDDVKEGFIAAATDNNNLATDGSNALNPLNPNSVYLVAMYQQEGTPAASVLKGYDIVVAGADGKLTLTGTTYDGNAYVAPKPLVTTPELEEPDPDNEVKANGAYIGETVNFKLTSEVPAMTGYNNYFFVINDKMDSGLTYDPDSLEVYVNKNQNDNPTEAADKLTKDTDYTVEVVNNDTVAVWDATANSGAGAWVAADAKDPRTGETVTGESATVTTLRVIFKDMLQYRDYDSDNDDAPDTDLRGETITVKYSATVNQNSSIYYASKNGAWLQFSKDPTIGMEYDGTDISDLTAYAAQSFDPKDEKYTYYDAAMADAEMDDAIGSSLPSFTYTYIGQLKLTKVDGTNDTVLLPGAKFKITGTERQVVLFNDEIYEEATDGTWYMLKDGTYTEIAPDANKTVEYKVVAPEDAYSYEVKDIAPTNGYYWLDTDTTPHTYNLIGTGTNETPVAEVPTNAVIYERVYRADLYGVKSGVTTPDTAKDDDFTALTPAQVKTAVETTPATLYERSEESHADLYDSDTKYKIATDAKLVDEDIATWTNKAKFQMSGYTDENGVLVIEGIGAGTYTIEELISPEGYNLLGAPITVVVSFTEEETPAAGADYGEFSATVDGVAVGTSGYDATTNTISFKVINNQGIELPETGGIGTTIFYTLGGLLVLGAGILLITRKRMGAEE